MALRTASAKLSSISPYSQSKVITIDRDKKETHENFESRVWRERMHVNESGFVYIPGMAFKNCLAEAAKYLSRQVPGKGKATYTKYFETGILCIDPLVLSVKADEVMCERLHVPSDGKRGGSKRVWKNFPVIRSWTGTVDFQVLEDAITREVFEEHLAEAGKFIGIGRFRPRNNGFYGRFNIDGVNWL